MKLILSLLCVLASGGVATHAAPKPNIIVILADDLGWADLGCYGNPSAPLPRDTLYWHLPHYHHSTPASALRRGDWKLIEFFEDSSLQLFNLRADPGEKTNLAASEPARAKELQAALAVWRQQVGARMPVPNPKHDPARAHDLGKGDERKKKR